VIRVIRTPAARLELLSGLPVEGRENYQCYKSKRELDGLFPWMIEVTRLLLFALVRISACLFQKKSPMLFKKTCNEESSSLLQLRLR